MRNLSLPLALAACLGLAAPAAAAPMRAHFTGTVTFDDTGGGLAGETWSGHYDYDTALPSVFYRVPPPAGSGLLLELVFSIGSQAFAFDAAFLEDIRERGQLDARVGAWRFGGTTSARLETVDVRFLDSVNGEGFSRFWLEGSQIRLWSELRSLLFEPNPTFLVASLDSLSAPVPIPEPSTLLLLGIGLAALAQCGRATVR